MSRYDDLVGQPTMDIQYCIYCKRDTEQHYYRVRGWRCNSCNQ